MLRSSALTVIPTLRIKRLTQAKKQKEKEKKELENMNRKHLANMRVVQKNLVYVVGLSSKLAKEEVSWHVTTSSVDDVLTPTHSCNPPADPDAQEQRVLWPVWSNLQDPHL